MAGPQSPLVQKIRSKYPEYDDIPDDELEQKILAKYPQYSDLASWAQNPTAQGPEQPFYDKAAQAFGSAGKFLSNRVSQEVDRGRKAIDWATSPSGGALPEGDKNAGGPLDLGLSPLKRVGQVLGIGRREEVPNIQGPELMQIPGVQEFGEHAAGSLPTSMAAASRTFYGGGPELSKNVLGFLATQDPRVVSREGGEPYVWDPPEGSFKYSRVPPEPGAPRVPVNRQLPESPLGLTENAGAAPEPPPPPPVQPFSPVEPPPEAPPQAPITAPSNIPPPAPRTQATVPPEIQAQIAVIQKAVQDGTLDRADGMLQITRLFMTNMKKTPVPPPVVKAEPTAPVSPFTDIKSTPPEQAQPPQAAPAAPVEQPAMPAAPTPVAPPQATGAAPFSPVQDLTNAPAPPSAAPMAQSNVSIKAAPAPAPQAAPHEDALMQIGKELMNKGGKPTVKTVTDMDGTTHVWINGVNQDHKFGPGGATDFDIIQLHKFINHPEDFKRLWELQAQQAGNIEPAGIKRAGSGQTEAARGAALFSPVRPLATAEPPVQPFAPVQPAAPIAKIPPQVDPSAKHWMDQVEALDKIKAPDTDYRDILSSGARSKKKGETWRGKVLGYIALKNANYTPPQLEPEDSGEPVNQPAGEPLSKYRIKTMPPDEAIRITQEDYKRGRITRDQAFDTMHNIQAAHDLEDMPELGDEGDEVPTIEQERISRPFKSDDLFKGTSGEGLDKEASFEKQWEQAAKEARLVGLDPNKYDNLNQLQWDITRKAAIETKNTGRNPLRAESAQGGIKIETDTEAAANELITGYEAPTEAIMVRESMQNAMDAVKHLGKDGYIEIEIPSAANGRKLIVHDNGKGMTLDEIKDVFTTLHKSGKVNEEGASGGKGVGKAPYMLGGKHFESTTIADEFPYKVETTIAGTKREFLKHVMPKQRNVSHAVPTGTTIKTTLLENQLEGPANDMIKDMMLYSRDLDMNISVKDRNYVKSLGEPPYVSIAKSADDTHIWEGKIEGHDFKLTIPKGDKTRKKSYIPVRVLNNGIFQYTKYYHLPEEVEDIPSNLILNVHPNAKEGTKEYPFPTQRESMKEPIPKKVNEIIEKYVSNPQIEKKKNRVQELYDEMSKKTFPGITTERTPLLFDPGERLTPEEKEYFENSYSVKALIEHYDQTINDIVEATGNTDWAEALEGVGLILDPTSHGIMIPNPKTGKVSILLNPFHRINTESPDSAALDGTFTQMHEAAHIGTESPSEPPRFDTDEIEDPRLGKFFQAYLQHQTNHGGLNMGHSVSWLKRLGVVFANYGPRKAFASADKLEKIFSDIPGRYNADIQELSSIYQESRGRPATKEDLLSRTGVQQKSEGPGGEGDIPSDARRPRKRAAPRPVNTPEEAVAKLNNAIQEAMDLRAEQEASYTAERGRRIRRAAAVNPEKGEAGFYSRLSKMAGPYAKVDPGPALRNQFNQKDADLLFQALMDSPNIDQFEKLHAGTGLLSLLNGDKIPQNSQIKLLDQAFGSEIELLYGGLGAMGKVPMKIINEVVNLPKALMASVNFHAVLRQASPMMLRGEYWKSFGTMIRAYGSKKVWEGFKQDLETRKYFVHPLMTDSKGNPRLDKNGDARFGKSIAEKMGLRITEINGPMDKREESFMATAVGHIPLVAGSNRAYAIFLNKIRTDTFENMMEQAKATKQLTPEMGRAIARFINNGTGQGSLGKLEAAATELNMAFFSPRLKASMLAMMNPIYYKNLPWMVRKEALKSLFAVLAFGTTVGAIIANSKLGSVELNPTSADFGKIRIGNTRIDMFRGFQQIVVAAARLRKGEITSSTTGETKKLGRFDTPTHTSLVFGVGNKYQKSYMENQFSPTLGAIDDWASGRKIDNNAVLDFAREMAGMKGEAGNTSKVIANLVTPMFINEVLEIQKDDPNWWRTSAVSLPGAIGAGEQTYPPAPPKSLFNPTRGFSPIRKP
jgi:hypothetical protein